MIRTSVLLTAALLCVAGCPRPHPSTTPPPGATPRTPPTLDPEQIAADIRVLADDGWAGRYTKDLEHLGLAADYIAKSHRAAGLKPVGASYRVDFEYPAGTKPGNTFHLWIQAEGDAVQVSADAIVAASFGPERVALGTPVRVAPGSVVGVQDRIVLTPAPDGDPRPRLEALAEAGAKGVLFLTETLPEPGSPLPDDLLPAAWVTQTALAPAGVLDVAAPDDASPLAGVTLSMARADVDELGVAPNVLAWIEGTEHPEEIVLLGAHYDHIGTQEFGTFCRDPAEDDPDDQICNGADDNASGTALLMDIARAIGSSGYRPQRTLVFAHFAAEELGLHGSRALAAEPPAAAPFDRGEVVAMLNMDMVGRLSDEGLQVGGHQTSPAWPELIARAAPESLKIVHPDSVTGRSDHAHWFERGIPILFFFTGLHEDYHRTSDEFEGINLAGIADIGRLVLAVTLQLADGAALPRAAPSKP